MSPRRSLALYACICLVVAVAGCSGASEQQQKTAQQQQEWAWLEQTKQQLDAKRQELAALRQQLHDAPVEEAAVPEGVAAPAASRAELETRIATLETEIGDQSEEMGGRLVAYINSFDTAQGDAMPAEQEQAIRMKSDEDIEVAQEWIEKGGDYRRAIEIYETQRHVDPGYDRLEQALASAQQMRYMTEERFAQVKKGMTRSEVRAALGPVNLHNVQQYPDRNVEAWFYPREGGGASGVYFRLDEAKNLYVVYQTTFEVKGKEEAPGPGRA
jgi:septal ring factor EnvC (AmiA/AmiB activator)